MKKNQKKQIEIEESIIGYYEGDIWEYKKHPIYKNGEEKEINRTHDLSFISSENLKRELKFYLIKAIENDDLTLKGVFDNRLYKIKPLFVFINENYSSLNSIVDLNKDIFEESYSKYIITTYEKPKTREFKNSKTPWKNTTKRTNEYISAFRVFYDFMYNFYDEKEETEKDIWDVRKLGIDYNHSKSNYTLNFKKLPRNLKILAKKYMNTRLVALRNMTWGTANVYLSKIEHFFTFINIEHPDWNHLRKMKRDDIENFLKYLRRKKIIQTGKEFEPTDNHIHRTLSVIETFIGDIQRYEWEEAPEKPVTSLILPGDKPKTKLPKADDIKYIPDEIWEQVMQNLDKLSKSMQLLTILLEATGFRITDTTALKTDCLVEKEDGYWIKGDQRKVKEKGHRVPVSKEIAILVKQQMEYLKTLDKNITKNNYLIPMESGPRKGEPILPKYYADTMNSLSHECQIKDKKVMFTGLKITHLDTDMV